MYLSRGPDLNQRLSRKAVPLTAMLKILSTESAKPKKSVVRVGGSSKNRAEPVGKHEVDGNENGARRGDFNRRFYQSFMVILT